ncbi:hypothetical protein [Chamaesiphon sp.]
MNKQSYHKPEFRMYGNISVMTQNMGRGGSTADGATTGTRRKTS